MIPKIIHYCWLSGDKYPPLVEKCISSWKTILPDYEFILWDKSRIDINNIKWVKEAYEVKKYAFAADYIRMYVLYHYGGIYLDADVEVLKSFNPFLNQKQFLGEDAAGDIEAAVMGAEKGLDWVKECLDHYENRAFIQPDGSFDLRPVPLLVAEKIKGRKIEVLSYDYFSPKNFYMGKIKLTSNTVAIHHYDGKWVEKNAVFYCKKYLHTFLYFLFGRKGHNKLVHSIRKIFK